MTNRRVAIIGGLLALMLFIVPMAMAAESLIDLKVTDKVIAMDKNGNEYVRLIVGETKSIQGVSYEVGVAAMAFGQTVDAAKTVNVGDNLKAIVNKRTFNGRESYTILKML
ncbi:MAG: hypothetical protein MIO92_02700 [Methanosarcinaceae archaeon]|nr:hypothetical protein [Methanosarcinaceae archaeon]